MLHDIYGHYLRHEQYLWQQWNWSKMVGNCTDICVQFDILCHLGCDYEGIRRRDSAAEDQSWRYQLGS